MTKPANRLYFLDAIRAFAIMMMLQGHFVHALLGDTYRDENSTIYGVWEYFRGMTAPTFFTITGFIFTYLLLKQNIVGLDNPRVLKGIKRAVKVIFWGYLLRLSFYAVFNGTLNPSFFYVDVLQCIGTSLLLLIGIYLILYRYYNQRLFQNTILGLGIAIFLLQPVYGECMLDFLPQTIANYFTNKNGSIFTLLPWFGYVCFGSFMATLFLKYGKHQAFYTYTAITLLSIGLMLIFYSSNLFMLLHDITDLMIFRSVAYNNFLFIRLGNVCILFTIFILLKNYMSHPVITKIGGRTLSIYIIHFFVLYGSWFGLGLNSFFYHDLSPVEVTIGALLFVMGICALVLYYYKYEDKIKTQLQYVLESFYKIIHINIPEVFLNIKNNIAKKYRSILYTRR